MKLFTYKGTRWTIKELAAIAHVSYSAMITRLKKHNVETAVKLGRYAGRNRIEKSGKLITLKEFKDSLKNE